MKYKLVSSSCPGISVITPTWNRAASLAEALESVLLQDCPPAEHLVMDNLSDDGTGELLESYRKRAPYPVVHVRERDGGMYEAQNKAVRLAKGEAIYVLNDDDVLCSPEVLGMLGRCLNAAGASIAFGDTEWRFSDSESCRLRRHNQVNRLNLIHKGISQQALLYRADVFEAVGPFDESFRIAGDYEWLLRALVAEGVDAVYLRFSIARCSVGGLSNAEGTAGCRRAERREAIRRHFSDREVRKANWYRRIVRKIPFGTLLMGLFAPIALQLQSVRPSDGDFVRDWRPYLGY